MFGRECLRNTLDWECFLDGIPQNTLDLGVFFDGIYVYNYGLVGAAKIIESERTKASILWKKKKREGQ